MKQLLFSAIAIAALTVTACNNSADKNGHEGHNDAAKDTVQHASATNDADVKMITPMFTNVDAKASASMKQIFTAYMDITTALGADDAPKAGQSGIAMASAIGSLDKSLLTDEQKKMFDEYQASLKEHAEHIADNKSNIQHQREHFAPMSEEMYGLAKAFGAGQPVYQAHCPMYNENKGGMWLTVSKEIRNPYFGSEMLTCGKVQEMIH